MRHGGKHGFDTHTHTETVYTHTYTMDARAGAPVGVEEWAGVSVSV